MTASHRDGLTIALVDVSGVAASCTATHEPRWLLVLATAITTLPGISLRSVETMRSRILAHIGAKSGNTNYRHPQALNHPWVQAILAYADLTHDASTALHALLRSPEWVAVHGVAFDAEGRPIATVWTR